MSDISNAPILTRPQKNDPLEVEKILQGVTDAVETIPEKMGGNSDTVQNASEKKPSTQPKKEDKVQKAKEDERENKRFQALGEKIGQTVGQSSQTALQSVVPAMLGPLNLAFEPLKELTGFNVTDSIIGGLGGIGKGISSLFTSGKDQKNIKPSDPFAVSPEQEQEQKEVGAYGSGIEYEDKLDRKTVMGIDPGAVYVADSMTEDDEEHTGFFENLMSKLGIAGLGGMLLKGVGLAALAVAVVKGVIDAVWGWGQAEDWGVDGWIGAVGGFLSGKDDGWKGAIIGGTKLGTMGVALGAIGGPVGMIVGGLLGAAVGGVLGYLDAEDVAVGIQGVWDKIKETGWLAGLAGAAGGAVLGFKWGGPLGAVQGALLGFALGALLQNLDMEDPSWANVWDAVTQSTEVMTGLGAFTGLKIGAFFGPVGMLLGALMGAVLGIGLSWIARNKAEGDKNIEEMDEGMSEAEEMGYTVEDVSTIQTKARRGKYDSEQQEALAKYEDMTPQNIVQDKDTLLEFAQTAQGVGIEGSLTGVSDTERAMISGWLQSQDEDTEMEFYNLLAAEDITPTEAMLQIAPDTKLENLRNIARAGLLNDQETNETLSNNQWTSVEDAIITNEGQIIRTSPDDNIFATKNDLTLQEDLTAMDASDNLAIIDDEQTHSLLQDLITLLRDKEMGGTAVINNQVSRFSPESVYQQLSAR